VKFMKYYEGGANHRSLGPSVLGIHAFIIAVSSMCYLALAF
jgi:hypothetical protein